MSEQTTGPQTEKLALLEKITAWKEAWLAMDGKLPKKEDMEKFIEDVGSCPLSDLEGLITPYTSLLAEVKDLDDMIVSLDVSENTDFLNASNEIDSIVDRAWVLEEIAKNVLRIIDLRKSLSAPVAILK